MSDTAFSWKQAFATAAVACIFTVLAGIVTYRLTTREPDLRYSLVGGPPLSLDQQSKQIFVLQVRNTGEKEIEDVIVQITPRRGFISDHVLRTSPGLKADELSDSVRYEVTVPLMNPRDSLAISFLVANTSLPVSPVVAVRGKGTVGQTATTTGASRGIFSIALFVGAVAATLASWVSVTSSWGGITREHDKRKDVIAYVLGRVGLFNESRDLILSNSDPTYRSIADHLTVLSVQRPDLRQACRTALKCLMHHPVVSDTARAVIARALRVVGTTESEIEVCRGAAEEDHVTD
jgi:hypothetical protein